MNPSPRFHRLATIAVCCVLYVTLTVHADDQAPADAKPDFKTMAQDIKPWLTEVRQDIHRHPELGFEEVRTSKKVKDFLRAEGIEFQEMAKTGICAIIRGRKPGATIGIRADMDALPIQDLKKTDYASQYKGKCHACGHDAHTTILMGTAKLLQQVKDDLPGNVKLFFEPAEEIGGGAAEMIEQGALKNPEVDAVIGMHMCNIKSGTVLVKKNGPMYVSSSPISIHVCGQPGHAAFIHCDHNSVLVAGDVLSELHKLAKRYVSSPDTRLGIGLVNGGLAENAVSKETEIRGTIRCTTREGVQKIRKEIEEILKDVSAKSKCKCTLDPHTASNYPVYNQDEMVDLLSEVANGVLGAGKCRVSTSCAPACFGGESYGYFAHEKPSVCYWLGGAKGQPHAGNYDIDMNVLPYGVAIHCGLAWKYLHEKTSETK